MGNIWVSSDLHLNHKNILTFKDSDGKPVRDFHNVHEMNEYIIEKHNSVVKEGDKWYCLGDVFFGPKEEFEKLWPRLNGSKRLVVGNHDNIKYLAQGGFFKKIMMWRMWPDMGLLFTHVPIHESGLWRGVPDSKEGKRMINVHGHLHTNPSPTEHHRCVCMEQLDDYTPVNIEELRQW